LYNTLKTPHRNIVTARWPGQLKEYDNTPFILFEYVEGKTVEQLLGTFSLEEAIQVIQQTAADCNICIKKEFITKTLSLPNLVYTSAGIKIIDLMSLFRQPTSLQLRQELAAIFPLASSPHQRPLLPPASIATFMHWASLPIMHYWALSL
jgi:serine/threonine protein kinase